MGATAKAETVWLRTTDEGPLEGLEVWCNHRAEWLEVIKVEELSNRAAAADPEEQWPIRVYFDVPGTGLGRKMLYWGSPSLRLQATEEEVAEDSESLCDETAPEELEEIDPGLAAYERELYPGANPFCLPDLKDLERRSSSSLTLPKIGPKRDQESPAGTWEAWQPSIKQGKPRRRSKASGDRYLYPEAQLQGQTRSHIQGVAGAAAARAWTAMGRLVAPTGTRVRGF
mmetsp:Transcript_44899/g.134201  ORF Transcript_44899/g.134201 Transcript_44899/m.134201 type:complete len:228 (+) Transcript_44899:105-788(+)